MGYPHVEVTSEALQQASASLAEKGVTAGTWTNFCFVGTLGWHSDFESLAQVAERFERDDIPIRLLVAGDGPALEALRKRAAHVQSRLVLLGWLGKYELQALMRMCAAGLAPYRETTNTEGNIPNKPIEYLSAALPVITTATGYLADLLKAGECGYVYRHGDASALATLMLKIHEAPALRALLAANAHVLYRSRFTAEAVYGEMVRCLEEVVRNHTQKLEGGRDR